MEDQNFYRNREHAPSDHGDGREWRLAGEVQVRREGLRRGKPSALGTVSRGLSNETAASRHRGRRAGVRIFLVDAQRREKAGVEGTCRIHAARADAAPEQISRE